MRLLSIMALSSLLLTGCRVTTHKNGDDKNVDIGTPFGSMQVKTKEDASPVGLGIAIYPGAQMLKKNKDNGSADVNMNFGSFHLGVKAVSYTTPDSPDKVLAFYKQDLAQYGDVLHCDNKRALGEPSRTAEGLTCDSDESSSGHLSWDSDSSAKPNRDKTELRAGSKQHQHIVAVELKDGRTNIGLVALDLPTGVPGDHHKDTD
jgi:hypothetical protein